jgi:hypothetical protein
MTVIRDQIAVCSGISRRRTENAAAQRAVQGDELNFPWPLLPDAGHALVLVLLSALPALFWKRSDGH